MIDYILTLIISFAGLVLGGVLAKIAPEELKSGERYWKILEWIVLAVIIAVISYYSRFWWAIPIAAILVFLKIFKKEYPALAFVLLISAFGNFLFLAGSLIFIYSLASGTLDAKRIIKKQGKKWIMINYTKILYIVLGFALLPLLIAYA